MCANGCKYKNGGGLNELQYQDYIMFNRSRWAKNCTVTPLFYICCYGAFFIMKIYRIDGNRCFSEPSKGLSYHLTKELAEKHLTEKGFYLETRKWEHIGGHEPNTPNKMWYNIKLSDDGYSFDNTRYCFITEIDVNDGVS